MAPKRKRPLSYQEIADAYQKKRQKIEKARAKARRSRLLRLQALPAELRNRIWEYALISPTHITIDTNFQQPALLQTCRQIRYETIKMYYLRNRFETTVHDTDATIPLRWRHSIRRHVRRNDIKLRWYYTGRADWKNLLRWCKFLHENKLGMVAAHVNCPWAVIHAAHRIARTARTWKECLYMLEGFRTVAAWTCMPGTGWGRDY